MLTRLQKRRREEGLGLVRKENMTQQEIRDEIRSILKDYHYDSDTENMSKDVVTALENLVGDLKDEKN